MSKQDLWSVVGRAKTDLNFSGQLFNDFEAAVKNAGYVLDHNEISEARNQTQPPQFGMPPPGMPPPAPEDIAFQRQLHQDQMTRVSNLWKHVSDSLKSTLTAAARTYRTVTWMNTLMFGAGLGLFLFAAIYGALTKQVLFAAVFGGLGAGTFVSLFMLGSIDKTQHALSNLVQVEIAFTNYLEQVTFWEAYAQRPEGFPPMPALANIEKASASLHQRSMETIQLLEEYVETPASEKLKSRTLSTAGK